MNFLESVKHCSTQNPCESLNHVIWGLAPKEQHVSPMETSLAVNIGVCIFNSGTEYTLKQLLDRSNLDWSTGVRNEWSKVDNKRISLGNYSVTEERKLARK